VVDGHANWRAQSDGDSRATLELADVTTERRLATLTTLTLRYGQTLPLVVAARALGSR